MDIPILKKRLEQVLAIQWTGDNIDAIRKFYNGKVSIGDSGDSILLIPNKECPQASLLHCGEWLYFSDATHDFHIITDKEMQLTFS